MKCKKCGAELNWGDRVCAVCGEPTGLPQFCEHCGARIREGQKVCPGCGAPVPWAEPDPEPEHEPAAAEEAEGEPREAAAEPEERKAEEKPSATDATADEETRGARDEEAAEETAAPADEARGAAPCEENDAEAHAAGLASEGDAVAEESVEQVFPPADSADVLFGAAALNAPTSLDDVDLFDEGVAALVGEPAAEEPALSVSAAGPVAEAAQNAEAAEGAAAHTPKVGAVQDEASAVEPVPHGDDEAASDELGTEVERAAEGASSPAALGVTQPMGAPSGAVVPSGETEDADEEDLPHDFDPLSAASTRAYTAAILAQREAEEAAAAPAVAPASDVESTQVLPKVEVVAAEQAECVPLGQRFPVRVVLPAAVAVALFAAGAVAAFSGGLGAHVPSVDFGMMAQQGSDASATPAVRDSVDAYSWEELSQISALIAQASSDAEGLQIASQYNLCAPDGTLDGTQAKQVALLDGTETEAYIAGFRHDDRADGAGKAGITFIFSDIVATHDMNDTDGNDGGWEQSALRAWMNDELLSQLPDDLRGVVLPVSKLTNNTGFAVEADAVTATQDTLWVPSLCELCGTDAVSDGGGDTVYDAEGSQYQVFSDIEDEDGDEDAFLVRGLAGTSSAMSWWERTPYTDNDYYFMSVSEDGTAGYYRGTHNELGVVPGFCL